MQRDNPKRLDPITPAGESWVCSPGSLHGVGRSWGIPITLSVWAYASAPGTILRSTLNIAAPRVRAGGVGAVASGPEVLDMRCARCGLEVKRALIREEIHGHVNYYCSSNCLGEELGRRGRSRRKSLARRPARVDLPRSRGGGAQA